MTISLLDKIFNSHTETISEKGKHTVFISHNSKNNDYGNSLRELLIGVGLANDNLIYTSNPANGIPVGRNIYDYLQQGLAADPTVLFLLSSEYFSSIICLNEMGATWVKKNDYYVFFLPGFNIKQDAYINCCIDKNMKGVFLNGDKKCEADLKSFMRDLIKKFQIACDEYRLNNEVKKCCKRFRKISILGKNYTSRITKVNRRKDFIFCQLNSLLPMGEDFHRDEQHWVQISLHFDDINPNSIEEGMLITFIPKVITAFEKNKYGIRNFRNIYVESGTIKLTK